MQVLLWSPCEEISSCGNGDAVSGCGNVYVSVCGQYLLFVRTFVSTCLGAATNQYFWYVLQKCVRSERTSQNCQCSVRNFWGKRY